MQSDTHSAKLPLTDKQRDLEDAIADFIDAHPDCTQDCFETIRTLFRRSAEQSEDAAPDIPVPIYIGDEYPENPTEPCLAVRITGYYLGSAGYDARALHKAAEQRLRVALRQPQQANSDAHAVVINRTNGKYSAACQCGWESDEWDNAGEASAVAGTHLCVTA